MPNHVENELRVSGKREDLIYFRDYVKNVEKGEEIDHDKIIPYPKEWAEKDKKVSELINNWNTKRKTCEYEKMSEDERKKWELTNPCPQYDDGYNHGGYDWFMKNMGTKWGIYESVLSTETKRSLLYYFNTAWSPPIPLIDRMSEAFPKLIFTLKYWEGASGFKGIYQVKMGAILKDESSSYYGPRGG